MSTVDLIALLLDGTYGKSKADVRDKYVVRRSDGGTVAIERHSAFEAGNPLPFDTVAYLVASEPPSPMLDPNKRRQVVAGYNDPWPVYHNEAGLDEQVKREAQVLKQTARAGAIYAASQQIAKDRKQATVFVMLAGAATIVAILFAVMVMGTRLL